MWELLQSLLGNVTQQEVILAAVVFAFILLYTWAPRAGEWLGGMFE